jgi:asparagine synthase (glutamine-hydrolysing)
MMGDERPFVEAFAAAHPGIEPHFTANEGYEFDHRLNELFHLIGGAPSIMGTMYVFHGLMSEAAKQSCDLLLTADWGNLTFSAKGESGFVEYLLKGQWRQLWLALTKPPMHTGSFARRFAARSLSALLPNGLWRPLHRMVTRKKLLFEHMQPLSSDYRRASGVDERLSRSGWLPDRYQPWNRRQLRQQIFDNENWKFEFYQGLEQMYGVAIRDPTAYRPFVEFCLGLPTKMFMRDGEIRWLARRMARGVMPEAQRLNPLEGWWDADWRLRIGRRRDEFLAELDRLQQDERFGTMLDIPRLRSGLVDLPPQSETDPQKIFGPQFGIQTALVTSRFINYVEGRNA